MKQIYLLRHEAAEDGVWGALCDNNRQPLWHTLEHAYAGPSTYIAKLPEGTYTLTRGVHQLETGAPFDAYCVAPFVGWDGLSHTGVLIHAGNRQEDSRGCILIGSFRGSLDGQRAVLSSVIALKRFMAWVADDQITLTVEDAPND